MVENEPEVDFCVGLKAYEGEGDVTWLCLYGTCEPSLDKKTVLFSNTPLMFITINLAFKSRIR
jgi:hypothetical protein